VTAVSTQMQVLTSVYPISTTHSAYCLQHNAKHLTFTWQTYACKNKTTQKNDW